MKNKIQQITKNVISSALEKTKGLKLKKKLIPGFRY